MRRATPLEQVQTVPLMRHVQGQVGRTVECSHRKGTERGLLPAFSISNVLDCKKRIILQAVFGGLTSTIIASTALIFSSVRTTPSPKSMKLVSPLIFLRIT